MASYRKPAPYSQAITDFAMSIEEIEKLGQKYGLTYHVPYLNQFMQLCEPRGKDILEVGGALPKELVIDYLGCNSWTCTESPDYDAELGAANQQTQMGTSGAKGSYATVLENIENFDDSHADRYDYIFSIACFEHISKLPEALTSMHRCLKSGGVLFSMFSPIWSSYQGHHLYHCKIPDEFSGRTGAKEILLPWEHLLKPRYQLHIELTARFNKSFADEIIYHTFNSPHINRYLVIVPYNQRREK
jgi:SAM-dependent methyltransferase